MEKLIVHHLKGWLRSQKLIDHGNRLWAKWVETAQQAEQAGETLVVFQVPVKPDGLANWDLIADIEGFIQDRTKLIAKAAG